MSATATETATFRTAPTKTGSIKTGPVKADALTRALDLAADGLLPPWVEPSPCAASDAEGVRVTAWAAALAGTMAVAGLVLAFSVG